MKIKSATQQSNPVDQTFCRNCSISHSFRDTSIFVFCVKNSKWPPFFRGKVFVEIQAFLNKIRKFIMAAIFWHVKYWLKFGKASIHMITCGSKIWPKSLNLAQFSRYKHFKMAAIFWQVKYSLKLGKASLNRYPVGKKFCQNRSILHSFRDTSIFVFCATSKFLFYAENGFKKYSYISIVLYVYIMNLYFQFCVLHFFVMTPIFGEEKFFGKLEISFLKYPVGRKF